MELSGELPEAPLINSQVSCVSHESGSSDQVAMVMLKVLDWVSVKRDVSFLKFAVSISSTRAPLRAFDCVRHISLSKMRSDGNKFVARTLTENEMCTRFAVSSRTYTIEERLLSAR